jgi:hypothetical protein
MDGRDACSANPQVRSRAFPVEEDRDAFVAGTTCDAAADAARGSGGKEDKCAKPSVSPSAAARMNGPARSPSWTC